MISNDRRDWILATLMIGNRSLFASDCVLCEDLKFLTNPSATKNAINPHNERNFTQALDGKSCEDLEGVDADEPTD